jgi:integrase
VPPQALEVLREQRRIVDERLPSLPFVFFREPRRNEKAGAAALLPIGDFDKAWQRACVAPGVGEFVEMADGRKKYYGKVVHDFRRSTARLLSRAGVNRNIAKKWLGHKTDSMYTRYDIPDERDLENAAQMLGKYAQIIEDEANRGEVMRIEQEAHLPQAQRLLN